MDLKSYICSVSCIQDCEVYSLNCQNYDRLVIRRNPKTAELLRDNAYLKLTARLSRLSDEEVPLLGTLLKKLELLRNGKDGSKHRKNSPTKTSGETRDHSSGTRAFLHPPRGPLINMYGPGTVYHRNKVREEAKMKKQSKLAALPVTRVAFATPLPNRTAPPLLNDEDQSETEYDPETHRPSNHSRHYVEEENAKDDVSGQLKSPENQFRDEKTSDLALGVLEQRIQEWHSVITEANNAPFLKDYMKLHRCYIEVSTSQDSITTNN